METHLHERARPHTCPFCHDELSGEIWTCPSCHTAQHLECARDNRRCTSLGCGRAVQEAATARTAPAEWTPMSVFMTGLAAAGAIGPILGMIVSLDRSSATSVVLTVYGVLAAVVAVGAIVVWRPEEVPRPGVAEQSQVLPVLAPPEDPRPGVAEQPQVLPVLEPPAHAARTAPPRPIELVALPPTWEDSPTVGDNAPRVQASQESTPLGVALGCVAALTLSALALLTHPSLIPLGIAALVISGIVGALIVLAIARRRD